MKTTKSDHMRKSAHQLYQYSSSNQLSLPQHIPAREKLDQVLKKIIENPNLLQQIIFNPLSKSPTPPQMADQKNKQNPFDQPELQLKYKTSIQDKLYQIKLRAKTSLEDWLGSMESDKIISQQISSGLDVSPESSFVEKTSFLEQIPTNPDNCCFGKLFRTDQSILVVYTVALMCKYLKCSNSLLSFHNLKRILAASTLITVKIAYDEPQDDLMQYIGQLLKIELKILEILQAKLLEAMNYEVGIEGSALYTVLSLFI